ncbi:hypothetical protein [Brevibacillus invocatus]|uniref:Uncharacterized protein n=1 Tax=Brevibacillus invocatus TaxID=173959 RepID=A0A3M8C256_9BACL|nr:hypothetical protein [Brevibacillus invocatus]MCM3081061.1 hypothetical protein [Brevibacillus invocatus]MCM3431352.1 hypothetical protein [Brevibacillus invocatus]RNB69025.1 hypothetical protein EDM52_19470 [Brevibacillus invocatus]
MLYPLFLLAAGILVMIQPRTKRWQTRMHAHFKGNEQRIKQRANTFFLLGFAFIMAGLAYLYRSAVSS